MTRTMFTRLLLVLITIGALLGFSMGRAEARPHEIMTRVAWFGADCIYIDAWNFDSRSYCGSPQVFREHQFTPGANIGVDPIMGSATYIICTVFVDGQLDYVDSAVSGDGSDVNCSRTLFEYGNYYGT